MDMENYKIKKINNWLPWFVGFTDAEGNFQVYPKKRTLKSGNISKVNVGHTYHLSLHRKDLCIVKDIQNAEYKDKIDSILAINDKKKVCYT